MAGAACVTRPLADQRCGLLLPVCCSGALAATIKDSETWRRCGCHCWSVAVRLSSDSIEVATFRCKLALLHSPRLYCDAFVPMKVMTYSQWALGATVWKNISQALVGFGLVRLPPEVAVARAATGGSASQIASTWSQHPSQAQMCAQEKWRNGCVLQLYRDIWWLASRIGSFRRFSASVFEPHSCGHRLACEDVVDLEGVAFKSIFVFGIEGLQR